MLYIAVGLIAGMLFVIRGSGFNWWSPPLLAVSVWLFHVVMVALAGRDFVVEWPGLLVIVVMLWAFVIPYVALMGGRRPAIAAHKRRANPPANTTLLVRSGVYGGSAAGFVGTLYLLGRFGFSLADLTSSRGLFTVGNTVAVARYAALDFPMATLIGLAGLYVSAILAGYHLAVGTKVHRRAVVAAPLIVAVFYSTITTARTGVLYVILLGVSSWAAHTLRFTGAFPTASTHFLRRTILLSLSAMATFGGFVGLALIRTGLQGAPTEILWTKIRAAVAGGVPAFTAWFSESEPILPGLTWGTQSIAGISEFAHTATSQGAVITTAVGHKLGASTTVHTAARALFEDYGLAGAFVTLALAGLLGALAHRRLEVRDSVAATLLMAILMSLILWSGIISILSYRVIVIAFIASGIVIVVAEKWGRRVAENYRSSRQLLFRRAGR